MFRLLVVIVVIIAIEALALFPADAIADFFLFTIAFVFTDHAFVLAAIPSIVSFV